MNEPRFDAEETRRRVRRHTLFLLAAMALLLAYCGWILARWEGIAASILAGAGMLVVARNTRPEFLLRAIRALPLARSEAPALYEILFEISRRAGLAEAPLLYTVGAEFPAAFTLGREEGAAIVLSAGLVRELSLRELAGILAHEIVHLKNHDLALMQLAMVARRVTSLLSRLALLLVFFNLLLRAVSAAKASFVALLLLVVAPTGVGLLELALSREREAEADLEAALLTGDPMGLASALAKIRRRERRLAGGRFSALRVPPLLRDHPATEERIRHLLAMEEPGHDLFPDEPDPGRRNRASRA
jgi:heat shock protein HtpX